MSRKFKRGSGGLTFLVRKGNVHIHIRKCIIYVLRYQMHWFPMAAVTNYHRVSVKTKRKLFHYSSGTRKSQSSITEIETEVSAEASLSIRDSEGKIHLSFSDCGGC